jgi:hypothetical protein
MVMTLNPPQAETAAERAAAETTFIRRKLLVTCSNEQCAHDFFPGQFRDSIDEQTGVRTIYAKCPHCKTEHTQRLVLRGGEWVEAGPPVIVPPTADGGRLERIAEGFDLEAATEQARDRELLDRAIARTRAHLSRLFLASESIDAGRPLSTDDRRDLDRLDTDYDAAVSADGATPISHGDGGKGGSPKLTPPAAPADQASKLRDLVYSSEDPAALPADQSVLGDVPFRE